MRSQKLRARHQHTAAYSSINVLLACLLFGFPIPFRRRSTNAKCTLHNTRLPHIFIQLSARRLYNIHRFIASYTRHARTFQCARTRSLLRRRRLEHIRQLRMNMNVLCYARTSIMRRQRRSARTLARTPVRMAAVLPSCRTFLADATSSIINHSNSLYARNNVQRSARCVCAPTFCAPHEAGEINDMSDRALALLVQHATRTHEIRAGI